MEGLKRLVGGIGARRLGAVAAVAAVGLLSAAPALADPPWHREYRHHHHYQPQPYYRPPPAVVYAGPPAYYAPPPPPVYYAPPPVYYPPPVYPVPSLNFVIPLRIR